MPESIVLLARFLCKLTGIWSLILERALRGWSWEMTWKRQAVKRPKAWYNRQVMWRPRDRENGRLWPWWTAILSPEWLMWCPARVWWRTHCHSVALICSQSGDLGDHWSLGELGDHSEEPPAVEMAQAPSLTLSTVSIVKDLASTKDILGLQ